MKWLWVVCGFLVLGLLVLLSWPGAFNPRPVSPARYAPEALRALVIAQRDFRDHDRDGNGRMDYWRKDVAGLYALRSKQGVPLKLIELAVAIADDRPQCDLSAFAQPSSRVGLWFRAIRHEGEAQFDPDRFVILAFPKDQTVNSGMYAVSEDGKVYRKEALPGGTDFFPANAGQRGWTHVE